MKVCFIMLQMLPFHPMIIYFIFLIFFQLNSVSGYKIAGSLQIRSSIVKSLPSQLNRYKRLECSSSLSSDVLVEEPKKPTTEKFYASTPTFKEVLQFAAPAMGIYVAGPLMSLIDAAFVGRVSSLELAALGPGSTISDSFAQLPLFLSIATTNLAARAFADKDVDSIGETATIGCILGAIIGTVMGALIYGYATPLSQLYCKGQAELVPFSSSYIRIRALALPFVVVGKFKF